MITNTSMTMRAFMKALVNEYIPAGATVMIEGAPGCGKTKIPLAWLALAQRSNPDFGGCFINGASAEAIDWRGMPLMSTTMMVQSGQSWENVQDINTRYGMPAWLQPAELEGLRGAFPAFCPPELREASGTMPEKLRLLYDTAPQQILQRSLKPYSRGLIVVDECRQVGDPTSILPLASIADDGRVGQWGVPRGPGAWAVLMVSNRAADNAGVVDLHTHTRNRMAIVAVRIEYEDVVAHWHRIGMRPEMIYFARAQPQHVFTEVVPANQEQQFCTARSWDYASREIAAWYRNTAKLEPDAIVPDHADTRRIIAARCGEDTANAFFTYLSCFEKVPSYEDVVANPRRAKLDTDNWLANMTTVEMLGKKAQFDDMGNVTIYVQRLGKILGQQFAERVIDLHGTEAMQCDEFIGFVDWLGEAAKERLWR